jgi:hypothetical protein
MERMEVKCKDKSIFGRKQPVYVYGMWVRFPLVETVIVHYCLWGKPIKYKTVVIDGVKTDLHREELLSETIAIPLEIFNKHFEPEYCSEGIT